MDLSSAYVFSSPLINHKHKTRLPTPSPPYKPPSLTFPGISIVDTRSSNPSQRNRLRARCTRLEVEDDDESCELVSGTELTIGDDESADEGGGGIQAYLYKAVKNNNATGILLLSDIFGFQDSSTRDFAYRVACGGYNVLVPDLFNGDPWTKNKPDAMLQQWINEQRPEHVAGAILASAKWLAAEFESVGISKKLGIIGFCHGGGRVVDILAQDQGTYFGCGVSFYGTRIDPGAANNIKMPLLLITGDNDALCPVSVLEGMAERNKEVKMVVFPERGHGFVHRPQTLEEDSDAEKAFGLMRDWLADGLLVKV